MGNYELLKAAINDVIKANGRQEITGEVLNQVLLSMVNSLGAGYQCMGVATPSTNPGTPDQNVFYFATQAGTYTNFDAIVLQAGISVLIWDGDWASQTWFTVDSTPTNNSQNLIASGAVFNALKLDGGAYDVSAHNSGATFASLSALLNSANLATLIPTEIRHGGMSIKFVQSSDNKYVQYRLISNSFNTTVDNWQKQGSEVVVSQDIGTGKTSIIENDGIDIEVLNGDYTKPLNEIMADFSVIKWNIGSITQEGVFDPAYSSRLCSSIVKAPISLMVKNDYYIPFIARYDDSFNFIERVAIDGRTINIESGYLRVLVETVTYTPIHVDDDFINSITLNSIVDEITNIYNIFDSDKLVQSAKLFELNLFNRNDVDYIVNGYVNWVSGAIDSPNENYESSGYISITGDSDYVVSPIRHYAFYTKSKTFISGAEDATGGAKVIHSPSNAAYLRVDRDKRIIYSHDIYVHSGNDIHALYRDYGVVEFEDKVNDIALPSKEYMLKSLQNDMFVEPVIKRMSPYGYDVRFSGSVGYTRKLKRVASVVPSANGAFSINLVDRQKFISKKTINSNIIVGDTSVDNGTIKVSIIGDSFTQGSDFDGFFKTALLDEAFTPNIQLIGTRRVKNYPTQYMEGRGGWKMSTYFSYIPTNLYFFNPFMQPDGTSKFWGSVQFWKKCWEVHNGTDTSWEAVYNCGAYDDCITRFDDSTGYLLNPTNGDMMYDFSTEKLRAYNGTDWYDVLFSDYSWSFNYSKYLSMWSLQTPDILCEMLGLNDFYMYLGSDCENIDFTEYFTNLEIMINSFKSANPNGKFAILIPCSSCGSLDNINGEYTDMTDAAMWNLRKTIIDRYDNQESHGIYLVDIGIAIDKENGFVLEPTTSEITKPFVEYTGDKRLEVQVNVPHPTLNYKSMGRPLAAFIQYVRN